MNIEYKYLDWDSNLFGYSVEDFTSGEISYEQILSEDFIREFKHEIDNSKI